MLSGVPSPHSPVSHLSLLPSYPPHSSVLDVLLSESRLLSGLTGLGLSVSDAHSLVQTPVHSQTQSFAVDMRSDSVVVSHVIVMWFVCTCILCDLFVTAPVYQ